jgi:hypothetical protein
VSIALTLVARPNVTVLLVGGRLRSRTLASVDDWAQQAYRDTFVDVAFIATNVLSLGRGLTTRPRQGNGQTRRTVRRAPPIRSSIRVWPRESVPLAQVSAPPVESALGAGRRDRRRQTRSAELHRQGRGGRVRRIGCRGGGL